MTIADWGTETDPDSARDDDTIRARRLIDDRKEVTDRVVDRMAKIRARSVCAVLPPERLVERGDRRWALSAPSLADLYGVDSTEPFRDQPAAAVGTAFLVKPDAVATALHVARRVGNGEKLRFVFGYDVRNRRATTVFEEDDVYLGLKVFSACSRTDTALVQLDRPVTGPRPLRLRLQAPVADGEPIYLIGFPAGLPAKYANNARVVPNEDAKFFSANIDVMICNSGSPVFSLRRHDVVGIASRGPIGFTTYNDRLVSYLQRESDRDVVISRIENLKW